MTRTSLTYVAPGQEWLAARTTLLAAEKELTHARDRVNAARRRAAPAGQRASSRRSPRRRFGRPGYRADPVTRRTPGGRGCRSCRAATSRPGGRSRRRPARRPCCPLRRSWPRPGQRSDQAAR
ncbi:hypothetical protein DMH04_08735 [Kibdelosporangium aridum]|uniref:Uncharacterized protein n=1 Tax=Kibdelosporangium aridum TaxID=2030 RepID=A0A428ZKS1_KIBAR|nr:hypothetical protein DMH04_08735 [Kibdelosporangium aridum]